MITSVLVANRGEIARRIFRTARELGLECVAVYSTADAASPHVFEADAAVHLAGNSPSETYLRGELLIEAARKTGADAIHPGYGFLSENAEFARAVIEAGLTWIGPTPESIESMGSKVESKKLMAAAGVPVLAELSEVGADDLPVLVKASAGGGGRGMRVVRRLEDLASELEAAEAEALSAFGDGTVFCEPYLATGRHIEVQVLADSYGTVWAVGERECSIQRRHQKVVEEAPSPLVSRLPAMRSALFDAAQKAAAAIGYVGAGTVEFLADDDGRFFFLEMNTRLQVEHPVTELTTGLDLVALQLSIADGAALPPEPPLATGHAIEVRLYAEDPANDWQPQSGVLHRFRLAAADLARNRLPDLATNRPPDLATSGRVLRPNVDTPDQISGDIPDREGAQNASTRRQVLPQSTGRQVQSTGRQVLPQPVVRVDSGVVDGSVVSVYYDPMLAKVICWAPDRDTAARRLSAELARAEIHGVTTNRDLLVRILRHPAFLAGDTDTAFFDRHGLATLAEPLADKDTEELSALAAALADAAARRTTAKVQGRLPSGWRNLPSAPQRKTYTTVNGTHEVAYRFGRDGLIGDRKLLSCTANEVVLEVDGVRRAFRVAAYPGVVCVDSSLGSVALTPVERFPDPTAQVAAGSLLAPMPGTVVRVAVAVGDKVAQGQPLLWLEAMKMEHTISAPADGVVTELDVEPGRQVEVGAVLAVVQVPEESA
ncbi:acetyl/propionyl-CoA carboxylase subunit alpha [Kribbella sp. NBC_01245]|uniref:acetyl/propionyl/methylcrotonyl-CoA carboxylase subunit alpha n=1 Tax=Kribbella sp. NBC_01245 TaxID=2903578 RepID=UPI002E2A4BF3|nr:biotin carboxylase N-terminal domain-containing protein [Kribbella sp. NBC_01245]